MVDLIFKISFYAFYASLGYELIFINIPSVVSTKSIFNPKEKDLQYFSKTKQIIFYWSKPKKIIVFILPLICTYILYLLPILNYFNFISKSNTSNFTIYSGLVLINIGRCISLLFLFKAKKITSNNKLITGGVFKFTRNPCQTGLYLSFFGFLIIYPSALYAILFLIYILSIHYRILLEEDYLKKKFKENYIMYMNKTRRYL